MSQYGLICIWISLHYNIYISASNTISNGQCGDKLLFLLSTRWQLQAYLQCDQVFFFLRSFSNKALAIVSALASLLKRMQGKQKSAFAIPQPCQPRLALAPTPAKTCWVPAL